VVALRWSEWLKNWLRTATFLIALFSYLAVGFQLAIMQIAGGLSWVVWPGWFLCRHQQLVREFLKFPVSSAQTAWICSVCLCYCLFSVCLLGSQLNKLIMIAGFYQPVMGVWWCHCCYWPCEQQTVATGWLTPISFNRWTCGSSPFQARCYLATYSWCWKSNTVCHPLNGFCSPHSPFFVPGFLIITGHAALWQLAHLRNAGAVVAGINAV